MHNPKYEIIKEMNRIEDKIDKLKAEHRALSSSYCDEIAIQFVIQTTDFREKGHGEAIPFDKETLVDFITAEIDRLNRRSDRLLDQLNGMKGEAQ